MDYKAEIMAYALQNALEFGKTDAGKILPKLFQHGLKKSEIKEVMSDINEAVKIVNSMKKGEIGKEFEKFKDVVKKREEKERRSEELPNAAGRKKLVFRAAPFPSGALHIGNAKTYLLNALFAEKYGGKLLLIMDDTIGSAEKPPISEGYTLIEEAFKLLGVKYEEPIIYKSDRLEIYYEYAEKLIKKNKAYVCHCKQEDLRENRKMGIECGCRQYPRDIQMLRWKEMFNAEEGHAILRIKTDMLHKNPAFRDRVLFKISDRAHPKVGNKYRVWPSLEMSWAIDDHLLGITHIIRGNDLVMETEMEKYIWDIFKWKYPETIHTGLIRIKGVGAKVSKSKAQKEVLSGEFIGWDDPRTWSIQSIIKRGITKEAIREFVREIGLNRQDITVPIDTLYSINRGMIDAKANRYSFIEDPIEMVIENRPAGLAEIEVAIHPNKDSYKRLSIRNEIYVAKKDFEKHAKKEVRLINFFNVMLDKKLKITTNEIKKIPKINWVSERVPTKIVMPNGDNILGIAERTVETLPVGETIQFERFGFCRYNGVSNDVHEFWFAHR